MPSVATQISDTPSPTDVPQAQVQPPEHGNVARAADAKSENTTLTALDTRTGLMWARDCNILGPVNWIGAAVIPNYTNYAGHSNWRLPTKDELLDLVNRGQGQPAEWLKAQGFHNIKDGYYWTSLDVTHGTTIVRISDGSKAETSASDSTYHHVMLVRDNY